TRAGAIGTLRTLCILWLLLAEVSALQRVQSELLPLPLQLRIWQCRQRCYRQTLPSNSSSSGDRTSERALPAQCRAQPDCFMCHDYCRVLLLAEQSLSAAMCADRSFCSRGCRIACKYY
ncbi:hypothetical protein KR222_003636, partial [Zaprionus bogoriensis]